MNNPIVVIAGWSVREALRRKIFVVVSVLSAAFVALFWLGCFEAFHRLVGRQGSSSPVDVHEVAGATLFGLAMFALLFLGSVLAIFLAIGTVRGDAEAGVLQPLVVRPVGRSEVLLARWIAAVAVCTVYVAVLYAAVLGALRVYGGWTPSSLLEPGLRMAVAVDLVAAMCVLGSVFLAATANGIATFMLLGTGILGGLLGQVGQAIGNTTLTSVAHSMSWGLPFEALYQDALWTATAGRGGGITSFVIRLGPFGGASHASDLLWPWVAGYVVVVLAVAATALARKDL